MAIHTIAIQSAGEMGGGVGMTLNKHGHDVITCLAGRGAETRARAARAGFREVADLETLVSEADLVLSIVPPEAAVATAEEIAAAMRRSGHKPAYVDCNAVSPMTARRVGEILEAEGAIFIDGGIIGGPPGQGAGPRLYVSGLHANLMTALAGKGIDIIPCGSESGRASTIKMCFASLTKGTNALFTAVMLASESLGVFDDVCEAIANGQPQLWERIRSTIPRLPCDSGRWVAEMEEIARTYAAAGVTPRFHEGAADIMRVLAASPFGAETRETRDRSRTMEDTIKTIVERMPADRAAE